MNAMAIDEQRFRLYLDAGVIPAAAWAPLSEAQQVVDQANTLLMQAQAERDQVLEDARAQGRTEGSERALRDFAQALQALAEAREALTQELRRRASEVAIGVVKHIAPAIGAERLVASLVAEAMQKLVFEPHLLVRVHPDVAQQAREEVA
ncbi:hypothetical protein, partial [Dyella sp.]|uniref:hypothetical protein n=1 Tax=Dyella sp. TaxID=1869338 RepID=UPI002ED3571E